MYRDLTQWRRIRRRVLTGGVSQSQVARETGMARKTVRKMIESPIPPEFRRMKPITGTTKWPCLGLIEQILKEDQGKPKRQQHTQRQLWEWLKEDHAFSGGFKVVKDYVHEVRHRTATGSDSNPSLPAFSPDAFRPEDTAELTYRLIQSAPKREAIRLLRAMFGGGPGQVDMERLASLLKPLAIRDAGKEMSVRAAQSAFDWMRKVLQGEVPLDVLTTELGELANLRELVAVVTERRLSDRNRALAVLARAKGIDVNIVSAFLHIARRTAIKFWQHYQDGGIEP